MTIPFQRDDDRRDQVPSMMTDGQILNRLRGTDAVTPSNQTRLAQGRVWERLVSEHPALGEPVTATHHPAPAAQRSTAGPARRAPTPIGRRPVGGWRAAMDVAAVAALVIGIFLGARGFGIMPQGSSPNPMTTQSVAAATATETIAFDEAGTNRQPGPGPQLTPIVEWSGEYATTVVFGNNRLYSTTDQWQPDGIIGFSTPETNQSSPVTAFDLDPFGPVWTTAIDGHVAELSVSRTSLTVIAQGDPTKSSSVISLDAATGATRWSMTSNRYVINAVSNDATVLLTTLGSNEGELTFQALDSMTGASRWTRDIPTAALIQPVLADDQIAFATGTGAVHLMDAASGEDLWVADTGANSIPTAPVIGSDAIYVITEDLVVYAFDRASGDNRWGTGIGVPGVPPLTWYGPADEVGFGDEQAPFVHSGSSPTLALADGQLVVQFIWSDARPAVLVDPSTPLPFDSLRYDLVSLDATKGSMNWRQEAVTETDGETGWYANQVVVDGEQIYLTTPDAILVRTLSDGNPVWELDLPFPSRSSPVVIGGEIYLLSTTVLEVLHEPVSMPSTATPAASAL